MKKTKTKDNLNDICVENTIVKERLPYPFVHYPSLYGTFIGFSEDKTSTVTMCSCTKQTIEHLLFLLTQRCNTICFWSDDDINTLDWHELKKYFPEVIVEAAISNSEIQSNKTLIELFYFQDELCHKCNLANPTLRYCHPMYGNKFVQKYGWYFNQTYLNLAIDSKLFQAFDELVAIEERCPPEIIKIINNIVETEHKYWERKLIYQKFRDNDDKLDAYESSFDDNDSTSKLNYDLRRELKRTVENIVRENFGFNKIGEGLVQETLLYQIVTKIFPTKNVFRNKRPSWLEGLELDIYIPDLNLALEYQGQQHFHAVKHWGGEEALTALQERDKRKLSLCEERGINLFLVNYYDPLTEEFVRQLLESFTN